MRVKYVGNKYKSFFGTRPYTTHKIGTGISITDREGDDYKVYSHGNLERDWVWVFDKTTQWITKDQTAIAVSRMSDCHLVNTIAHVFNGGGHESAVTKRVGEALISEYENRRIKSSKVTCSREQFIDYCKEREECYTMFLF